MKKTILTSAAVAALFAGGVAIAQPRGPMMGADADGDGNVTMAEINAQLDSHFAEMDSNSDGAIDATEREAAHQAMRARRADRRSERQAQNGATAGDGTATDSEHRRRGNRGGHHGGQRGHGDMMARLDTDSDGRITRAELGAKATSHFTETDTDGDGTITAAEREAGRDARRAEMRARVDTNGDGTVSPEERQAAREAWRARRGTDQGE